MSSSPRMTIKVWKGCSWWISHWISKIKCMVCYIVWAIINQPINESINQPNSQEVRQSASRWMNQSINQSLSTEVCWLSKNGLNLWNLQPLVCFTLTYLRWISWNLYLQHWKPSAWPTLKRPEHSKIKRLHSSLGCLWLWSVFLLDADIPFVCSHF